MHSDLKGANVLLKAGRPSQDDPRGYTCKVPAGLALHSQSRIARKRLNKGCSRRVQASFVWHEVLGSTKSTGVLA